MDIPVRTTIVGDTISAEGSTMSMEVLPDQAVSLVPEGVHVVRSGETFWSISQDYGVTVADLERWNPDIDSAAMPVGTLLYIAGAPAPEPTAGPFLLPTDAGVVDVRKAPYNAPVGGTADAAPAIRSAILANDLREGESSPVLSTFAARTISLGPAEYRIDSSLAAVGCSIALVGAGEAHTIIRPRGFTSAEYALDPGSRLTSDQGNSGFANHLRHFTVDFGTGAGRGIRYDAANSGSVNHVTVRGGDVGLSLETTTGPCMVADFTADGCTTGVLADQAMPNDTIFSGLTVRDAAVAVDNNSKNLTAEDWVTERCDVVYRARSVNATMIVIGGKFTGGSGGAAFDIPAGAFLYLRDVELEGYSHIVPGVPVPIGGVVKEWSTHPYRRGATSGQWSGQAVMLSLPSPRFPEPAAGDLSTWHKITGTSFAAALRVADTSGATDAYLPYGHYNLTENVTLRNLERLHFFFSEIVGSGVLTLAPSAGKTMLVEDMAAIIDVTHDGAGAAGLRHLGPVSGTSGNIVVRTGPNATGDLFLEDWGPHSQAIISRPVRVHARQINREGSDWTISGGAVVRVLGDNCETDTGRGSPTVTVTDATAEYLGGTWDNLGDSTSYPRTGAAWLQSLRSRVSIVMPSLWRSGGIIGHWISDDGVQITDAQLVKYPLRGNDQRCVLPPYVSS